VHRGIEQRLARAQAPGVTHRRALRACAAIGAGEMLAVGPQMIAANATLRSIRHLGAEAAAELASIPDTKRLRALDEAFAAANPRSCARMPAPVAVRMLRLVERYRRECDFDQLEREAFFAEIAARAAALAAAAADPAAGDPA
jgi:hypothetical protein